MPKSKRPPEGLISERALNSEALERSECSKTAAEFQRRRLDEFMRDWEYVIQVGYPRRVSWYRPEAPR